MNGKHWTMFVVLAMVIGILAVGIIDYNIEKQNQESDQIELRPSVHVTGGVATITIREDYDQTYNFHMREFALKSGFIKVPHFTPGEMKYEKIVSLKRFFGEYGNDQEMMERIAARHNLLTPDKFARLPKKRSVF